MDLNRFSIPLTPVALQVQFVYISKIEFRNTIVRDQGECTYQAFLKSSRPLRFLKSLTETCGFIFIFERGLY
jgi:hypothetical protein